MGLFDFLNEKPKPEPEVMYRVVVRQPGEVVVGGNVIIYRQTFSSQDTRPEDVDSWLTMGWIIPADTSRGVKGEQVHITCPRCKKTSYHPEDVRHGWCANCNVYTSGRIRKGDDPEVDKRIGEWDEHCGKTTEFNPAKPATIWDRIR